MSIFRNFLIDFYSNMWYNFRSSKKDVEKNMLSCEKSDYITPFDGTEWPSSNKVYYLYIRLVYTYSELAISLCFIQQLGCLWTNIWYFFGWRKKHSGSGYGSECRPESEPFGNSRVQTSILYILRGLNLSFLSGGKPVPMQDSDPE